MSDMRKYKGYLMKINGHILDDYIMYQTYKAKPNQRQDKNSTEVATGELVRKVLPHTRTKIEFTLLRMTDEKMQEFLDIIRENWIEEERKVTVEYYDIEKGIYKTGKFYIPDIEFSVYRKTADDLVYNSIRLAWVEY